MLFFLAATALVLAVAGCGYLLAAMALVRRADGVAVADASANAPGVSILKPLSGDEPGLLENLASFCAQDYGGQVQIIFGVQDPADAAVAVVERLRGVYAGRDLALAVESAAHGVNRKVTNLINMAPRIAHDVVVVADSDIRVEPGYLARVVATLDRPAVGAVTCLYYGVPRGAANAARPVLGARLSALAINAHFLPGIVVGLALGRAQPCFGSTIALRRAALHAIGGFAAFANCIADDYAIGRELRAQGFAIAIPPFAVAHVCSEASLRELWQHELRWARTIRSIDPAGYAGSLIAHPLPLALIAALLGAGSVLLVPALAIAGIAILARIALLRRIAQAYTLPPQAYWLVPVRDLLSFAIFVASFFGRDVTWRGHSYRIP